MCAVDETYRIVVVGDDASSDLLMQRLAESGLYVERMGCGARLVDGEHDCANTDLVIVDASQADSEERVCGLTLGKKLRACPQTVSIPVIAVGNSTQHRLRSFEIGVDDYIDAQTPASEFQLRLKNILRVNAARQAANTLQLSVEKKRCKELGDAFRRYVAPTLVDEILSRSQLRESALVENGKSARTTTTVLFADMRGFTRMSEQLSPDDVVPLLNDYFRLLTEIVAQYQGTVFNMAGDCLMVGFGVPQEQHDAPARAFRAARNMLERFSDLARGWRDRFGIEVGLGIGINTGEVIAGNVGSPDYMNYTVIGDVVNVAARFSQRARAGEMLFSRKVKNAIEAGGENCHAVLMEPICLHGRAESIDIFCLPVPGRLETPPQAESSPKPKTPRQPETGLHLAIAAAK